jgi:hypothetical protein
MIEASISNPDQTNLKLRFADFAESCVEVKSQVANLKFEFWVENFKPQSTMYGLQVKNHPAALEFEISD